MSRRRLHGETQKRRKKKATKLLKRMRKVERVAVTQVPAAFERSPEIARHDIEFLEAMHDMGVRRQPGRPVSPAREEAAQGIHFQLEIEDQDLFHAQMRSLGVQPLPAGRSPQRVSRRLGTGTERSPAPRRALTPAPPGAEQSDATGNGAGHHDTGNHGAALGKTGAPPAPPAAMPRRPTIVPARGQAAVTPGRAAAQHALAREDGFTVFEESTADHALMAAAFSGAVGSGERKFQGAPAQQRPAPRKSGLHMPDDPDAQLDLHGKALDQALHMVQNFLLTAYRQGLRHVLVVTGKGLNSGDTGPVLRSGVVHWLERDGGLYVESFDWAPAQHGGQGAIWIVLRDWRRKQAAHARSDDT